MDGGWLTRTFPVERPRNTTLFTVVLPSLNFLWLSVVFNEFPGPCIPKLFSHLTPMGKPRLVLLAWKTRGCKQFTFQKERTPAGIIIAPFPLFFAQKHSLVTWSGYLYTAGQFNYLWVYRLLSVLVINFANVTIVNYIIKIYFRVKLFAECCVCVDFFFLYFCLFTSSPFEMSTNFRRSVVSLLGFLHLKCWLAYHK